MKVAFFGTPEFAQVALAKLLESKHQVVCVVAQPDKPAGRGRKLAAPAVKVLAESAGVPVLQPASVRKPEFHEEFRRFGVDIAVVVAYGKILPPALLEIPRHGFVNIHASLLPKYRGAAPIQWALVRGERVTGVTIMRVEEGLDSGPLIAVQEVEILDDDDARSLHDMLSVVGAGLLVEVLDELEEHGHFHSEPQNEADATYAPLIKREDARIDWEKQADEIICAIRGFVMWPGAFSMLKGKEFKITSADGFHPDRLDPAWRDQRVPPGMIVDTVKNTGFVVKTGGDGLVLVLRVKPEGRAEMDAWSAINGGLVDVGTRFGTAG